MSVTHTDYIDCIDRPISVPFACPLETRLNRKGCPLMLPYQHSLVNNGAGGSLICLPFVTQSGMDVLANQFTVRDNDLFVVSYPKSGTNWVRQIVHLLLHEGVQGDKRLHETVPLLEKEASDGKLTTPNQGSERRCFISHLPHHLMPGVKSSRARYIVVVRNPKDCAVSYFHFMASRSDLQYQGKWDDFFPLFLHGQVPYGLWFDHVTAWWQASQQAPNILFVTYEELQKDLTAAVNRMAHFMDIPLTPALCASVVAQSRFTAMAANPKVNAASSQAGYSNRILRKGEIGDWRNHFTPAQNAQFDALYQAKMAGTGLNLTFEPESVRTFTAYPLHDRATHAMPELARAAQQGWVLRCPIGFAATWNGGPNPEDIEIHLDADDTGADSTQNPVFVQSQLGEGLLTFHAGYQFKTEDGFHLWVCGPTNAPKDGLSPLDSVTDTSILPCTIAIHWQFTRPHQTIQFAAGEAFATILPYRKSALQNVELETVQLGTEGDMEVYEQAVQQMSNSAAVQDVFQRLGATTGTLHRSAPNKPSPRRAKRHPTESRTS